MNIILILLINKKTVKMFLCDGQSKTTSKNNKSNFFSTQPQPCSKHGNKPIKFVCRECQTAPLLCSECISEQSHKGHVDWISYSQFFTQEVVDLLKSEQSAAGETIQGQVDRLADLLFGFSAKIQRKLKDLEISVIEILEGLRKKFPKHSNHAFWGKQINNNNMLKIIKIVDSEMLNYSCSKLKSTFETLLKISEDAISSNLRKIEQIFQGNQWEKPQDNRFIPQFSKGYLLQSTKQTHEEEFHYSFLQKNQGIQLDPSKLLAKYVIQSKSNFTQPAALVDRLFDLRNNSIVFKVTKLPKTWMFFDACTIYLGACVPEIADKYQYLNLCAPSHGAYLISSAGRSYHTKLPEFQNQTSSLTFGEGDVIKVGIDFVKRTIFFYKKGTDKTLKFQMPLSLDQKYIQKLKPCVMFSEEKGAEVKIINQKRTLEMTETQSGILKKQRIHKSNIISGKEVKKM